MRLWNRLKEKVRAILHPNRHARRALFSGLIYVVIITGAFVAIWFSPTHAYLASPEALRQAIDESGLYPPLILFSIHVAQVVLAPIPGQAIEIANGYLFGWLWGGILSIAGIALGSFFAIALAKRFGRPLVEILITQAALSRMHRYIRSRNRLLFFVLFLLPGTPDDLLCFAIGLTSIPLRHALAIAFFGRIPGVMAAVIFGTTGTHISPIFFMLSAIVVSAVLWLLIFHTRLHKKIADVV